MIKKVKIISTIDKTFPTTGSGNVTGKCLAVVSPFKWNNTGVGVEVLTTYYAIKETIVEADQDLLIDEHIKQELVKIFSAKEPYNISAIDKSLAILNPGNFDISLGINAFHQKVFDIVGFSNVSRPNKEGQLTFDIPSDKWEIYNGDLG